MMTPTYEDMLEGATTWRKSHMGVSYILSHHGFRKPDPSSSLMSDGDPGTWCYYLLIPEQMYPHRWDDFRCVRSEAGFEHHGPAFDRDMFDSEITWSSGEPYFDRKTNRQWDAARVGCDYHHLWHHERGYPDTYASVNEDAKLTVEKFLRAHPDRQQRCEYSGLWAHASKFYRAKNGRTVHRSLAGTFTDGGVTWEPEEAA